jgi:hypothetical protein
VAAAWIVALEVAFPSGAARGLAVGVGALALALLSCRAESRDVRPRGAGRTLLVASAVWFGAYLLLLGPLVRWQADESLRWWVPASLVMASPFFVAAWRYRAGR